MPKTKPAPYQPMASRPKKAVVANRIANIRKILRHATARLAKTHSGCDRARGCACLTDRALTILEEAEAALFRLELESWATPQPYVSGPQDTR